MELPNNVLEIKGISPIFQNNPGFSVMKFKNGIPMNVTSYNFLVDQTINATDPSKYWMKLYDSVTNLGINHLKFSGIAAFQNTV